MQPVEILKLSCVSSARAGVQGGGSPLHIVELADGGSNEPSNLQLLCPNCHAKKTRMNRVRRASRSPSVSTRRNENDLLSAEMVLHFSPLLFHLFPPSGLRTQEFWVYISVTY